MEGRRKCGERTLFLPFRGGVTEILLGLRRYDDVLEGERILRRGDLEKERERCVEGERRERVASDRLPLYGGDEKLGAGRRLGDGERLLGEGDLLLGGDKRLLGDGVCLLGDGGYLPGDGERPLGEGERRGGPYGTLRRMVKPEMTSVSYPFIINSSSPTPTPSTRPSRIPRTTSKIPSSSTSTPPSFTLAPFPSTDFIQAMTVRCSLLRVAYNPSISFLLLTKFFLLFADELRRNTTN